MVSYDDIPTLTLDGPSVEITLLAKGAFVAGQNLRLVPVPHLVPPVRLNGTKGHI